MKTEEALLKKRFEELAKRAYEQNIYTYTGFLGLFELDVFHQMKNQFAYVGYALLGQEEGLERQMIQFGCEQTLGYPPVVPVKMAVIRPLNVRFCEELSHRDYLGALMHLGIERAMIGDILLQENEAVVFLHEQIADYVKQNLTRIRHTVVLVELTDPVQTQVCLQLEEEEILCASERLDGVLAKVYHFSRQESAEKILAGSCFVNGRMTQNGNHILKQGDIVSLRGYGRFRYDAASSVSKKGKLRIKIARYTG